VRWQIFSEADFGNGIVSHVAEVVSDGCVVVTNHLQI
jgi:hypothetical protein